MRPRVREIRAPVTGGFSDRREAALARLSFDAAARPLRETLAKVNEALGDVEPSVKRRVRLIVSEIVGHSMEDAEIRVEIVVLSETIRIEIAGRGLALPNHPSFHHTEAPASFPLWVLSELADHWEIDRRQSERGIWLLVGRG